MKHIAVDLGAESGRVIVGDLTGLDVMHRFPSKSIREEGHWLWDIQAIVEEILLGLKKAFRAYPGEILSIGVDTWGVDYALLDSDNQLLARPYHYRDGRTDGVMEELCESLGKDTIYKQTGIQFLPFNTLYQLVAEKRNDPEKLEKAARLLTIPDYLSYRLCGVAKNEFSNATTTQLYNPLKGDWAWDLVDRLELPRRIFGEVVMPGTILGDLIPEVAEQVGAPAGVKVIAPACHDTGSAVAAVPLQSRDEAYAYLSSGTWSLLGYELAEAKISEETLAMNFTNEGAVGGGSRFLKNIMGLWILQQCKRHWEISSPDMSYDDIEHLAENTDGFDFGIDVDDIRFLKPGTAEDRMEDRIREYCREQGLPEPQRVGAVAKVIFLGLAQRYAENIRKGDTLLGRPTEKLYVIGGGSKQTYLCRLTAKTTGLPISAGPVEATALGNILVQALALKKVSSIDEGRAILRENYEIVEFLP